MSLDNVKRVCVNIAFVFVVLFGVCINLNARIGSLNKRVSDLEWTVQEHELSIQRLAEKNNAQDVILNKLNSEYQMREKQRAEELKEVAELNGVGG